MAKFKRRMNLLYSNTPNPIIYERFIAIRKYVEADTKIYYIQRKESKISLPFLKNKNIKQIFEVEDTRGKIFSKIFYISKTAFHIYKKKLDKVYCFYPDMLLASVLAKILNPKLKIYYEIQDLNDVNCFFRALHCILMLFSKKIFITSPLFKDEFKPYFKHLSKRTIFIGNGPMRSLWKDKLGKTKTSKDITIGFVGMLRDLDHVSQIRELLEKTSYKIIQAGVCIFPEEIKALQKKFPERLKVITKFNPENLYEKIYPLIDIVWSCYPNNRNYCLHISRRFTDAITLNRYVIVSDHSKFMNSNSIKIKYKNVLSYQEFKNMNSESGSEIKELEFKWVANEFEFENGIESFIKAINE